MRPETAPAGTVAAGSTWQQRLSRPCFRSVPAHRIVGGGLGRRYDHAVRLSEHHHYSDDHQSFSPTTRVHGRPLSRGPRETAHRQPEFPAARDVVELEGAQQPEPPDPVPPGDAPPVRGRQDEGHGDGTEKDDAAEITSATTVMLTSLCLEAVVEAWESHSADYLPRAYHMPHELCARLLRMLVGSRKLTAFSLSGFLNPAALEVDLSGCSYVPKSVFKQLGFSCPRIVHLNLSMCSQVNNAVVRSVLQGCSALRQLYLDGCRHVTDAGFHLQQSPFYVLLGAVSLETISVQGCPQVTGELVLHLRKVCRNLKELDLARCKSVSSASVRRVFDSCPSLESLNVSFLESVVDEAFEGLPAVDMQSPLETAASGHAPGPPPPQQERLGDVERAPYLFPLPSTMTTPSSSLPALRHLNLARCEGVTDLALARVAGAFPGLEGVHLEHCLRVTDMGVEALAAGCRGLRALGLRNCGQITDGALEALSAHCPSLEWLDFSWCGEVSDRGVVQLAEGCPGLEEVQAIWCENITDVSLSALSKACTNLEALHIVGCGGATSSAVAALREAGVEVFQ